MRIKSSLCPVIVFALVVFFFLGLRTPCLADMTVTKEVTSTVGEETTTFSQTIYYTSAKMRMNERGGVIIITDLAEKMVTILLPREKSYIQDTFAEMEKREVALPPEVREAKFSVQETDEKKTIDEYSCRKLVFKTGPTQIAVWVTEKIAIDPAAIEFNKKCLELTKNIKTLNLQAQMVAEFEKRKVYPYLTVIEIPLPFAGETERIESKVKKVSYEKIDPSVFAIPEGYKKMALPQGPPQE